jgi:hypothetical protein
MPKSRRTALLAFCIFFTALGLSQQSTEWKEYPYAEDGFAISAPLEPHISPDYIDGGRGEGLLGHSYFFALPRQVKDGTYSFLLEARRRRDIDQRTPEQVLKDAKNFYVSYFGLSSKLTTPATVIYEKPISLGKYPGIEFEVQHENIRLLAHLYVVDRKMYSLTVQTDFRVRFPEEMQRWYNSFRFIEAAKQAEQ